MPEPRILAITSDTSSAATVTPVLASLHASGAKLRAIDVGRVASGVSGVVERVLGALVGEFAERRLAKELGMYPPDAYVVFDPGTEQALRAAAEQATKKAPTVAIIDSLRPDSSWKDAQADRYVVVDGEAAIVLLDLGIPSDKILVGGPMVSHAYVTAAQSSRSKLRTRFKIPERDTVVVVDVDGQGYEGVGQLVMQLSLSELRCTYLFDAGTDSDAATALRAQVPHLGLRAKLFGKSAEEPLYWRCADVVVGSPTPSTLARCAILGPRLVCKAPEDAGARARVQALEQRGWGATALSTLLITSALETVAGRPARKDDAIASDGARNAADIVYVVAAQREAIIASEDAETWAATSARVRDASAAARDAARVTAQASELEDLSSPITGTGQVEVPSSDELSVLMAQVNTRIAQVSKAVFSAREAAELWDKRRQKALDKPDEELARAAERNGDSERARMHAALAELSQLQTELKELEQAELFAGTNIGGGGAGDGAKSYPRPAQRPRAKPKTSVDDMLAQMKKQERGKSSKSSTASTNSKAKRGQGAGRRRKSASDPVDDELAALKRKMAGGATKNKKKR